MRLEAAANRRKESMPRREIASDAIFSLILNPPCSFLAGFSITEEMSIYLAPKRSPPRALGECILGQILALREGRFAPILLLWNFRSQLWRRERLVDWMAMSIM